jgi:multicomponent Na+:H+ antiporter subunit G
MEIRNILTVFFLMAGLFFFIATAIGVFRIKDFYCRLHVSGISGTMGLLLCCAGLCIYEGMDQTEMKLFLIFLAVFLSNPIGTHIIARVAYRQSLQKKEER